MSQQIETGQKKDSEVKSGKLIILQYGKINSSAGEKNNAEKEMRQSLYI